MSRSLAIFACACLVTAALVGCWRRTLTPSSPFGSAAAHVGDVTRTGGYLLASIRDERGELRFFFPDTPECAQVIVAEASVSYRPAGALGRVSRGDLNCDPVGIASLVEWRDRRARVTRPSGSSALPRELARFRVVYSDDDVIFVRGRFLIAREIRWIGDDTIAMLPARCRALAESGSATVEFRAIGRVPFRFAGSVDCPILGFARPIVPPR
jgi:hypothetical protein